jgi:hypothetical protein
MVEYEDRYICNLRNITTEVCSDGMTMTMHQSRKNDGYM